MLRDSEIVQQLACCVSAIRGITLQGSNPCYADLSAMNGRVTMIYGSGGSVKIYNGVHC